MLWAWECAYVVSRGHDKRCHQSDFSISTYLRAHVQVGKMPIFHVFARWRCVARQHVRFLWWGWLHWQLMRKKRAVQSLPDHYSLGRGRREKRIFKSVWTANQKSNLEMANVDGRVLACSITRMCGLSPTMGFNVGIGAQKITFWEIAYSTWKGTFFWLALPWWVVGHMLPYMLTLFAKRYELASLLRGIWETGDICAPMEKKVEVRFWCRLVCCQGLAQLSQRAYCRRQTMGFLGAIPS